MIEKFQFRFHKRGSTASQLKNCAAMEGSSNKKIENAKAIVGKISDNEYLQKSQAAPSSTKRCTIRNSHQVKLQSFQSIAAKLRRRFRLEAPIRRKTQ